MIVSYAARRGRVRSNRELVRGQYLTIIPTSGSHTYLPIDEPTPLLAVLGSEPVPTHSARVSDTEARGEHEVGVVEPIAVGLRGGGGALALADQPLDLGKPQLAQRSDR